MFKKKARANFNNDYMMKNPCSVLIVSKIFSEGVFYSQAFFLKIIIKATKILKTDKNSGNFKDGSNQCLDFLVNDRSRLW